MGKIGGIDFPARDHEAARKAVIRNARSLVETTQRAFPEWTPPPFDPILYAAVSKIPVYFEDIPTGWDALFVPLPGKEKIVVNRTVGSRGRRRFSLAHEIIHSWFDDPGGKRYHLRAQSRRDYERDEAAQALEKCCDAGAAELLMPLPWFRKEFDRLGMKAASVPELARVFEVSLEAAALRMVENTGSPCGIGFFELGELPSDIGRRKGQSGQNKMPAYRVRRLFKSPDFPFLFPVGKSIPEDSVIYRASLGLIEMNAVEEFRLGSQAAWLNVSAFPLHRENRIAGPPTVCATFTKRKS